MSQQQAKEDFLFPTFVARQPIFGADRDVWGYELLYRERVEDLNAIIYDPDSATLKVAAFAAGPHMTLPPMSKVVINFSQRTVIADVVRALPVANTVVEIEEKLPESPELLQVLEDLKRTGYLISIDGFTDRADCRALHDLADIAKIDVLDTPPELLQQYCNTARERFSLALAKRVETPELFYLARDMGFSLFQGFFFRRPEVIQSRTLSSNEVSRLRLFQAVEEPEPNLPKLTEAIQADVAISYRLLRYLNSPALGLLRRIDSIQQAIVLLGWREIRSWLRVLILTDLDGKGHGSELPYLSVQRSKFFELLTEPHGMAGVKPDGLVLLGLFSLLDTMLGLPMKDIVINLPLENTMAATLAGEETEFTPLLKIAKAFEDANWKELDDLLAQTGLDPVKAAQAYYDSMVWASVYYS